MIGRYRSCTAPSCPLQPPSCCPPTNEESLRTSGQVSGAGRPPGLRWPDTSEARPTGGAQACVEDGWDAPAYDYMRRRYMWSSVSCYTLAHLQFSQAGQGTHLLLLAAPHNHTAPPRTHCSLGPVQVAAGRIGGSPASHSASSAPKLTHCLCPVQVAVRQHVHPQVGAAGQRSRPR